METITTSAPANARVLVCAASADDLLRVRQCVSSDSMQCEDFLWGQGDLDRLGQADAVIVWVGQAAAPARKLLKHMRSQFSLLELPVLLLAQEATDDVFNLLAFANDFIFGAWAPYEVDVRLSKLLQVRGQFLETSALNLQLHRDLHDRSAKLKTLIENGLLMSATRDVSVLFRHALWEGKRLLNCDACSLYLVTPHKTLQFAMRTKSDTLPSNEIPLYHPDTGKPNEHYMSVYAALHGQSVVVDDVYRESRFDLSGTKAFDKATGYTTVSVLTVPMAARGGAASGVFQFINRKDPETHAVAAFPPAYIPLVEALAAQAAVTYENLQLLDERGRILDGLVHAMETVLVTPSVQATRHTDRVSALARMLAQAAHDSAQPPFADFCLPDDDAWNAALLHNHASVRWDAHAAPLVSRFVTMAGVIDMLTDFGQAHQQPRKLSEAIFVLHALKLRGLVDPDVFDLFLVSGAYAHYAEKFLHPEQRDAVDIQRYLG
ncbi:GAF domain-containing protein [Acidovorax soli]|uniref:GAF domain-containing protein n=1 Tax=Acidovorax soli TaxID=592050 RepID=UPI0032B2A6CB